MPSAWLNGTTVHGNGHRQQEFRRWTRSVHQVKIGEAHIETSRQGDSCLGGSTPGGSRSEEGRSSPGSGVERQIS
jgi:hypothetical protein